MSAVQRFHAPSPVMDFKGSDLHTPSIPGLGRPPLGTPKTGVSVMGQAPSQVPTTGKENPSVMGDLQGSGWAALQRHSFATTQQRGCKSPKAKLLPQTLLAFFFSFFQAANAGPSIVPSACAAPGLAAEPRSPLPWCHPAPGCGAGPCTTAVHMLKLQAWPNGFH